MAEKNMSLKKCPMPSLDAELSQQGVSRRSLPAIPTKWRLKKRAAACIARIMPCVSACPVRIDIPAFIAKVAERGYRGRVRGAAQAVHAARGLRPRLPAGDPVRIQVRARHQGRAGGHRPSGALRGRLASRAFYRKAAECPAQNGHKVAVIGAGPAGLTCAGDLAKHGLQGHRV